MNDFGFFPESTLVTQPKAELGNAAMQHPKCGACGLYKGCGSTKPYQKTRGNGKKGIMIVVGFPSKIAGEADSLLVGKSMRLLQEALKEFDIDMAEDCWISSALRCFPGKRYDDLSSDEVGYCRPFILKDLNELKPTVVILLGQLAIESVIGWAWKEGTGTQDKWLGWVIPDQTLNAWICPTYSIGGIVSESNKIQQQLMEGAFMGHLSAALDKAGKGRPWAKVPQWHRNITPIHDDLEVARRIKRILRRNTPVAVDYETNGLKPEYDGFKILCCSLSVLGSEKAFAFPWYGKSIKMMRKFWRSDVPKVASNLKYEDRVSRFFGMKVRRWFWDTMIAAHSDDCRSEITSIKFQVYVLLGVGVYNDHIAPFLRNARGRRLNDAEMNIDLNQLLIYCGGDSLYEGLVCIEQCKRMNAKLELK